jgi:hypothetical protein
MSACKYPKWTTDIQYYSLSWQALLELCWYNDVFYFNACHLNAKAAGEMIQSSSLEVLGAGFVSAFSPCFS